MQCYFTKLNVVYLVSNTLGVVTFSLWIHNLDFFATYHIFI